MSWLWNTVCGGYRDRFICDLCGASTLGAPCRIVSSRDADTIQHICAACSKVYEALEALRQ